MKEKFKTFAKYLGVTLAVVGVGMAVNTLPALAANTETGRLVDNLWTGTIYPAIKEIGGTLAIATFVCSAFYFWIIGKDARSLEKAKGLMIGSGVGIIIIYIAPKIIQIVIDAVSSWSGS